MVGIQATRILNHRIHLSLSQNRSTNVMIHPAGAGRVAIAALVFFGISLM